MSSMSERERLVESLIKEGYLKSPRIIKAFLEVPRENFVPEKYKDHAYIDEPLPIGYGQTISAPHMVAIMTELLKPRKTDKVLEIGSGSGYQACILSKLVRSVYTVEFEKKLCDFARKNLERLGCKNVKVIHGDGSQGYPSEAPYDKIIVTCATPQIFRSWIDQLKDGGIIVAPVGGGWYQTLTVGKKVKDGLELENIFTCSFVPLRR